MCQTRARQHVFRGNVPTWEFHIPPWLDKGYLTLWMFFLTWNLTFLMGFDIFMAHDFSLTVLCTDWITKCLWKHFVAIMDHNFLRLLYVAVSQKIPSDFSCGFFTYVTHHLFSASLFTFSKFINCRIIYPGYPSSVGSGNDITDWSMKVRLGSFFESMEILLWNHESGW